MRKLFWIFPILIGIFLGFAVPAQSAYYRYTMSMLPASGSSGTAVRLNCGWHGGGCGTGSGDYLDWDDTGSSTVYFRGLFSRTGVSYTTARLHGNRKVVSSGSRSCDVNDVDIVHTTTGTVLAKMRYVHMTLSSTGKFSIPINSTGYYYSRSIGKMINDKSSTCPWTGYHAHVGYLTSGAASRSKNSGYPNGDYCTGGSDCSSYRNDRSYNWTHKFSWYGY